MVIGESLCTLLQERARETTVHTVTFNETGYLTRTFVVYHQLTPIEGSDKKGTTMSEPTYTIVPLRYSHFIGPNESPVSTSCWQTGISTSRYRLSLLKSTRCLWNPNRWWRRNGSDRLIIYTNKSLNLCSCTCVFKTHTYTTPHIQTTHTQTLSLSLSLSVLTKYHSRTKILFYVQGIDELKSVKPWKSTFNAFTYIFVYICLCTEWIHKYVLYFV